MCLSLSSQSFFFPFRPFIPPGVLLLQQEGEEDMYFQSELSVGSTSPPPIDSPNSSSTHDASPLKFDRDPCFRCHKPGHWARNCPEKSTIPKDATPITSDSEFPHPLRCLCGFGYCVIRTSNTAKNPNRKFYTCPGTMGRQCPMFKWCDQVTMDEINNPPQNRYPECDCGAGPCQLIILKSGPNADRKCFVCSIKKGDGACSFSQLFDPQRDTVINSQAESKSISYPIFTLDNQSDSDLGEDGDVSFQRLKKRDFESPVMDNPQHSPSPVVISGPSKRNKVLSSEGRGHDEEASISSPKLHDPLVDGFAVNASSVPDSTRDLAISQENVCGSIMDNTLKASPLTSQADIRYRQTEFLRQVSSSGATSVEGSISQVLGLHVLVWLGRIVFSPPRCLTNPSAKPFFCCVFPNFDPIHVLKDADTLETEGLVTPPHGLLLVEAEKSDTLFSSTPRQDAQISSGVFRDGGIEQADIMKLSISEAFRQAALSMQNDLLNLLDSMEIFDHEGMVREAKLVFDALDHLRVEYRPFRERVLEFIRCASSLADIELTIWDDLSSQDKYDNEKDHFEYLSCSHAEAMAAFTASNERFQSLDEEASSIRNKLFHIENQLSDCKAETMDLEIRVVEISEEMKVSQQSLEAASQEAEVASKQREQREAELITAKAALEKAKLQLRL